MKSYLKMIFIILIAYILTFLALHYVEVYNHYEKLSLGNKISVSILRTDGTVDFHKDSKFPVLNKGDILTADIPIPETLDYHFPVLCFGLYNCEITLTSQGETLYTYGQDLVREGKHIGSVYVCVALPEEAIGSTLQLHAVSNENRSTGDILDMSILPGTAFRHWIIMDNLPEAVFLVTILTASFMMTVILILSDGRRKFVRVSLWLLSFLSLAATYRMASNGILYSLIGNARLCSNAEYVCFYAMPIPLLAFCGEFFVDKRSRIFSFTMLAVQLVFFSVITFLNYNTVSYHYCRFLQVQHILIGISMIAAIIIVWKVIPYEESADVSRCMYSGIYNFFICICLDMGRYYLSKFTQLEGSLLNFDFLFLGILLMSACFILAVFLKLTLVYSEKEKKTYYEHLAYTDILTDLENRTKYYEHIRILRSNGIHDYTIIFMDLNNLKEVNDHFGHEYGDLYIKSAAAAIKAIFPDADGRLRIGGDEFLVLYYGLPKFSVSTLIDNLKEEFSRVCAEQKFPFRGSIACGDAVSTSDIPLDVESAVKRADAKMYRDKEKIKALYGEHCCDSSC